MNASGISYFTPPSYPTESPQPSGKTCDDAKTVTYHPIDPKKPIVRGLLSFVSGKSPDIKGTAQDSDAFFKLYQQVTGPYLVHPDDLNFDNVEKAEKREAVNEYKKQERALLSFYKKRKLTSTEHAIPGSVVTRPSPNGYKKNMHELEIDAAIKRLAFVYQENDEVHKAHTGTRALCPKGTLINCGKSMTPNALADHEKRRVEYGDSMRSLLTKEKSMSAALQLQQLEYRHNPHSQLSRTSKSGTADWLANKLADQSYFTNIKEIERIYFVPDNYWETDQDIRQIHSLEVTDADRIEAAIARFYVQKMAQKPRLQM